MQQWIDRVRLITPSKKTFQKIGWVLALIVVLYVALTRANVIQVPRLSRNLQQHQPGMYRVVQVNDGDTLTVARSGQVDQVRMLGVNTPEIHHPEKPVQCYGSRAAQFSRNLIGEEVRLAADPLDDNRDVYGRLLRYVYTPDGTHVNARLISEGYGFAYMRFRFQKRPQYRQLQRLARENNRGLWGACQLTENQYGAPETVPVRR